MLIAEYVKVKENTVTCLKYRYQLQDKNDSMILRWDNAPHYEDIPTYPFHKHCQNGTIESSKAMNIFLVMEQLDEVLGRLSNMDTPS